MRKDARRFQRVNLDVPARIEFIDARQKKTIIESHVSNLSASGAFFPAPKYVPLGTRVKVDIFLEGFDPSNEGSEVIVLSVTAFVVRSSNAGTALVFTDDYRMTSSRLFDELLVTQDLDSGTAAYERFETMAKQETCAIT